MKSSATVVTLVLMVCIYFAIKGYVLLTFHPPYWVRIAMSAAFWGLAIGTGALLERKGKKG